MESRVLAVRLGTTPQLIEAMLTHLQRSGLIQEYAVCADGCPGCGLKDACNTQSPGTLRLWQSKPEG